jgi:hypothetical protein
VKPVKKRGGKEISLNRPIQDKQFTSVNFPVIDQPRSSAFSANAGGAFFIVVAVVALAALRASAQTNSTTDPLQWLAVPEPHRQTIGANISTPEAKNKWDEVTLHLPPAKATTADTAFQNTGLSASMASQNDEQFRQFILRHPGYGFVRTPREPDDRISRAFNAVFKPEPIRLGRNATFSCTIWTAIKRKNPLCLLNPIVISASW